ncbi:MAG: phosphate ABC transporter permease PstA [Planctomycetota bacterium]
MSPGVLTRTPPPQPTRDRSSRFRRQRSRSSLLTYGEPWVWLTGGALVLAIAMIAGLLSLVLWQGLSTFWQGPIVTFTTADGARGMGEIADFERFSVDPATLATMPEDEAQLVQDAVDDDGSYTRTLFRTGNFDLAGTHFEWVPSYNVTDTSTDEWAVLLEREAWGRFYGTPAAFIVDDEEHASDAPGAWALFQRHYEPSRERYLERRALEKDVVGRLNDEEERGRLRLRGVELEHGADSPEYARAAQDFEAFRAEVRSRATKANEAIRELDRENERFQLVMETAGGERKTIVLADVVRAVPANQLGFVGKIGVYLSRWWEFLTADPRYANSEGGVYPAIFGTVVMTLLMSILVVPFGVLAALYLREYAKQGTIISAVRIAVNNLAGVPSIVFGIFGLGFFCYIVGARIDELFYAERLPNPTFGTRGILWASFTLALLTLPVVIVATEEALSAVPNSMREGSYACGATKWQTVRRIVLPRAAPGIMTGMILAIARGAGEVAPLMLVGAMKLAPSLPIDGSFPYLHPSRSFMHLGFHIFDLGFQSQNSEAAKPMVYTTTLLLIAIVVLLNVAAIWVRARLRRRFEGGTI